MKKISSLIKIEKSKRHILILLFLTSVVFLIPTNSYAATAPSNTVPESAIKGQPNWSSTSCSLKTQASDAAGSEGLGMILSSDCFINTLTKQSATCTGTQGDGYGSILSCTIVNPDKSTQVTANAQDVLSNTNVTSSTKTNAAGQVISHTQSTSPIDPNAGKNCNLSNIQNCMYAAIAAVALSLLSLAGFILGFVGSLFNWVVVYTVFEFGSYFGNSTGLLVGWGILRDIGNIVLLFAFIFLGVLMILNLESINTRKAIPALLIAALLLNFSLFITEAVIDVSNVISAGLYNQAGNADCTGDNTNTCLNVGISGQIIKATGLADIFTSSNGLGSTNLISQVGTNSFGKMITYISLTIFVVVVIFVLLSAAVLLLIRAITLVFIMVLSPLAFVAMVIPPLADQGKKWQKILIGEAFFAPVYLLLVLVSLKIMYGIESGLNSGSKPQTLLDALGGSGGTGVTSIGSFSVIIIFALIVGFMFAALMTAKSMGAVGATAVTNAATRAVTKTVTAPLRLGAYGAGVAYRNTVGKGMGGVQNKFNTTMGKWRNLPGVTGGLVRLADNTFGSAVSGGIGAAAGASFGGAKSYADRKKEIEERTNLTGHFAEKAELEKKLKDGLTTARTAGPTFNNYDEAEKAIQKMPQADLEGLLKTLNEADRDSVAKIMSSDKLDKLLSNDKVDGALKEKIVSARFHEFEEAVKTHETSLRAGGPGNFAGIKAEARKLSSKEARILGTYESDLFGRAAEITNDPTKPGGTGESIWSSNQIDDINKNEAFTTRQRANVFSTKPTEQLKKAVTSGDGTAITNLVKNMSKEIGDLPGSALTDTKVIDNLEPVHLSSIMSKDTLSSAERAAIINHIGHKPDTDPQYIAVRKYLDKPSNSNWWGNTLP